MDGFEPYRDGLCCLCGVAVPLTGEHKVKASAIRAMFGSVRSANMALALSGSIFALAMLIASIVPKPGMLFEWACPILGLSKVYPQFGFDVQSSYDNFTQLAAPTVLLGLPTILLIASAILRIAVSRREHKVAAANSREGSTAPAS